MKQMRSRFRLITFLLICAFMLVLVLCSGSVLKNTGITLSSLSSLPLIGTAVSPDPSASPYPSVSSDITPVPDLTPCPSGQPSSVTLLPGTDNSPVPEYNVLGL